MWIRGPGIASGVKNPILGTHVDLMPTLLGLVHKNTDIVANLDNIIPPTMDGENLASYLLFDPHQNSRNHPSRQRRHVIPIEYIGLGNVVRYGHLEDSHNSTFRALRLQIGGRRNWKYVEFTNCETNWNFTTGADEYEFFDLDQDPYELHNLMSIVPDRVFDRLRILVQHLYQCAGPTCRSTDVRTMELLESLEVELKEWEMQRYNKHSQNLDEEYSEDPLFVPS